MSDLGLSVSPAVIDSATKPQDSRDYVPMPVEETIERIGGLFKKIKPKDVRTALGHAEKMLERDLPYKTDLVAFPYPEALGNYSHILKWIILPKLRLEMTRDVYRSKNLELERQKATRRAIKDIQKIQDCNILVMPVRTDFDHMDSGPPDPRAWRKINLSVWEVGLSLVIDPGRLMHPTDPFIVCPGDKARDAKAIRTHGPQMKKIYQPYFWVDGNEGLHLDCRDVSPRDPRGGEAVAFFPQNK